MKGLVAFSAALIACWCAIGGIVLLAFSVAVVEVLCIEICGLVLAVLGAALWLVDARQQARP